MKKIKKRIQHITIKETIEVFIVVIGSLFTITYLCGQYTNRIENVEKQMERLNNIPERV
jgi:hypothetical protein